MNKLYLILVILFCGATLHAQTFTGIVQTTDGKPIAYTNIGVVKKGIGTTSDEKGRYSLALDKFYGNDSLRFSCIGYQSLNIKVSDFMMKHPTVIYLKEIKYLLNEVVVSVNSFKDILLGYTAESHLIQAGFTENRLGYECGVLLKVKKRTKIMRVNLNVATCTYDSVMYRVNVYEQKGKLDFVNILTKPIYIKFTKAMINKTLSFDISAENVWINSNGLITIEHVKNMGKGQLTFCGVFPGTVCHRKTSQAIWETTPVGVGVFVDAKQIK